MIRNLFWIRSQTVFISLALFSMALSVSATHILIGFFFIAYFINYIKSKPQIRVQSINQSIRQLPGLLIAGGLLYSGLLLSALVHTVSSPDSLAYLQSIAQSELSDSLLYVFALLVFYTFTKSSIRNPKNTKSFAVFLYCIDCNRVGGPFQWVSTIQTGTRLSKNCQRPQSSTTPIHNAGWNSIVPSNWIYEYTPDLWRTIAIDSTLDLAVFIYQIL